MPSNIRTSSKLLCLLVFSFAGDFAPAAESEDFVIYEAQRHSAEELKRAAAGALNGGRISTMGSKVVIYGTKSQRDADQGNCLWKGR